MPFKLLITLLLGLFAFSSPAQSQRQGPAATLLQTYGNLCPGVMTR